MATEIPIFHYWDYEQALDSGDKIANAQGKVLMKGICDYVLKHSSAKTIERVAAALREKPSWVKAASED
jgi:hypothetical protein